LISVGDSGLFDLITKPDIISKEIVRCLALAEEGLHAVVLVLSVRGRITKEEEDALCTLQILFGATILDYLIVVFTGGDELDTDNQTLESYLSECPDFLKDIFSLCGHRKVLFYNRTKDEDQKNRQIQQLLDHVAAIGRRNGGKPFTERMHRKIKEETMRLRKEVKEAESKFSARDIEQVKKKLNEEHEHKMSEMAKMVQEVIGSAWEEQQRLKRVIEYLGQRKACNIM